MAQHDQVIDNGPGLAVRTDINAAILALFSSNSGTVEPAVKVAGQLWFDTSVPGATTLKVRDITNSAWITINLSSGGADQLLNGNLLINHTGASGKGVYGQQNAVNRWGMVPGDGAESGSNSGSDLKFNRHNDAGTFVDTPLTVRRSDGYVIINLLFATSASFTSMGLTNPLAIAYGGTGAPDTATARANLGLGSMAQQSTASYYNTSQVYSAAQTDARYMIVGTGAPVDTNGGLGTVVLARANTNIGYLSGIAGSSLSVASAFGDVGGTLPGTWRVNGVAAPGGGTHFITCFQRIA